MQTMRSILHISSRGTELTDEYGSTTGIALEVMLGTAVTLEFDLRGDAGAENAVLTSWPLSSCNAGGYYFALDTVTANSAAPKLLRNSGITFSADAVSGRTLCRVTLPNTAVTGVVSSIGAQEEMIFHAELGGIDDGGETVFAWQFDLTIRSRVYLGGGTESIAEDPAYYTAAQVEAAIGRALVYEYSIDGTTGWHAECAAADCYFRLRHGSGGSPSAAQPLPVIPAEAADIGALSASGQTVTALAAVSGTVTVPAGEGVIHTHTLAANEVITPTAPASGYSSTSELHLTQPQSPVTFTWGVTILWNDGNEHYASGNPAPDFSTGGLLYCVVLRYDGTNWLGNIGYTKEVAA